MSKLSNLPTTQDLNSVNYILIIAKDLSGDEGFCLSSSVKTICSSRVLGGKPINFGQMLNLCVQMKFVIQKTSTMSLTPTAKQFVSLNENRTYEISESQENFLIENMIFEGIWRSHARGFFLIFRPNYDLVTFEFSIKENPLPNQFIPIYQILKNLKAIETKDKTIYVTPKYIKHVKNLLAKNKGLSQEELKKLLDADQELGFRAEAAVVEYERKRLRAIGRIPESELVHCISQLNVSAGYDIASFDGDVPGFVHDRFIEVKASRQGKIRFYWSSNEYGKAKELGGKYWIYFMGNFDKAQQGEIEPVMIRDPVKRIEESSELTIRVDKYVVEETKTL